MTSKNPASRTMTIIHIVAIPRNIEEFFIHWSSLFKTCLVLTRVLFFLVCLLQTIGGQRRQAAEFTSYCRGTAEQAKQILGRSHDEFVSSLDIIRQSI